MLQITQIMSIDRAHPIILTLQPNSQYNKYGVCIS